MSTPAERMERLRAAAARGRAQPMDYGTREEALQKDADRRALEQRWGREVCATCSGNLVVAYAEGVYRLRCITHGNDPETRQRHEPRLAERYRKGGTLEGAGMTAIEAQTLALSLANQIRDAEAAGRVPRAKIVTLRRLNAELGIVRQEEAR